MTQEETNMNDFEKEDLDKFYNAVLKLKNIDECYKFFEDVFTIKELNTVAQRLEVARLLKANMTFSEIEKKTGASSATISRVNRPYKSPTGKVYQYGYIVDFVDIEKEYNNTLNAYIKELEEDMNADSDDEVSLSGLVVDKEDIKKKFDNLGLFCL